MWSSMDLRPVRRIRNPGDCGGRWLSQDCRTSYTNLCRQSRGDQINKQSGIPPENQTCSNQISQISKVGKKRINQLWVGANTGDACGRTNKTAWCNQVSRVCTQMLEPRPIGNLQNTKTYDGTHLDRKFVRSLSNTIRWGNQNLQFSKWKRTSTPRLYWFAGANWKMGELGKRARKTSHRV